MIVVVLTLNFALGPGLVLGLVYGVLPVLAEIRQCLGR